MLRWASCASAALAVVLAMSAPAAAAKSLLRSREPMELQTVFDAAYSDVKSCLLNANLLLASSQASLKRLQFSFNQLGLMPPKASAKSAFEEHTAALETFRWAADRGDSGGPRSERLESLGLDAKAARDEAARQAPEGAAQLLDKIFELRKAYDAARSRKSLSTAKGGLKILDGDLGKTKPTADQLEALGEGRRISKALDRYASVLRMSTTAFDPRGSRAGELALKDITTLNEDARALRTELDLLAVRYALNAHWRAHKELREGGLRDALPSR